MLINQHLGLWSLHQANFTYIETRSQLACSVSSYNRYGFVTFETEEEADKVKDKVLLRYNE